MEERVMAAAENHDLAQRVEKLEAERDALTAELKALREQEPVAGQCRFEGEREWRGCNAAHHLHVHAHPKEWPHYETRALYARPVPARRLTDEIISHLYDQAGFYPNETREAADHFARAIESALFGGELQSPKGED